MGSDQIHLEAVEHLKRINQITLSLRNNDTLDLSMKHEIATSVRFFGRNVGKLQECNDTILKLAHVFLFVQEKESNQWSLRDSNAFLLMITSLLLKRKEDNVIRHASDILKEFVIHLPKMHLNTLANVHNKHIQLIFHKMCKVATFYTQMKLLEVLMTILMGSDRQVGSDILSREALVALCGDRVKEELINHFHNLNSSNFLVTSRKFLEIYNRDVMTTTFIYSLSGYLMNVNGKKQSKIEEIKVDFNLRNLSVSFYIKENNWKNKKSGINNDNQFFIELEGCDAEVLINQFKNPNHIELRLTPVRSQIVDTGKEEFVEDLPPLESLTFVIDDEESIFMSEVYHLLKDKTPMTLDNMTDNDSLVSYRTIETSYEVPIKLSKQPPVVKKPFDEVTNITFDKYSFNSSLHQSKAPMKPVALSAAHDKFGLKNASEDPSLREQQQIPKIRQTAKIGPTMAQTPNTQSSLHERFTNRFQTRNTPPPSSGIYDDLPSDDSLPPVNRFMTQKREARKRKVQQNDGDENEDPSIVFRQKPLAASTAKKAKPTLVKKVGASKRTSAVPVVSAKQKKIEYFTDEDDDDIFLPLKYKKRIKTLARAKASKAQAKAVEKKTVKVADKKPVKITEKMPAKADNIAIEANKIPAKKDMPLKVVKSVLLDDKKPASFVEKKSLKESNKMPLMSTEFSQIMSSKAVDEKPGNVAMLSAPMEIPEEEIFVNELPIRKFIAPEEKLPPVVIDPKKKSILKAPEHIKESSDPVPKAAPMSRPSPVSKPAPIRLMPKKRVSFDDSLHYLKREHSSTSEKGDFSTGPSTDIIPENQEAMIKNQSNVVFNMDALNKNEILGMYINDSMTIRQDKVNYNDERFDDLIEVRTQTVQKKTSPTQIRTVQIQEINFGSQSQMKSQEVVSRRLSEGIFAEQLTHRLESKANEALKPLMEQIKEIRKEIPSLKKIETKTELRKAIEECRDSKTNLVEHVQEHVKLLKRLHHSKRKLKQSHDENKQSIVALKRTLKQAVIETRKASNERLQQIEEIKKIAVQKEMEIKAEVWGEYISNINYSFQQMLQSHRDINFSKDS